AAARGADDGRLAAALRRVEELEARCAELEAAVPELVERLAVVAPILEADLGEVAAPPIAVSRRNAACHNPSLPAAVARGMTQRSLNRVQREAEQAGRRDSSRDTVDAAVEAASADPRGRDRIPGGLGTFPIGADAAVDAAGADPRGRARSPGGLRTFPIRTAIVGEDVQEDGGGNAVEEDAEDDCDVEQEDGARQPQAFFIGDGVENDGDVVEDVADRKDGSLAHAARRRQRVLQRQVGESQCAVADDRDARRPGWQAADALAGSASPPSADEQRAGLAWLREGLEASLAEGCGPRRLAVLRDRVGEAAIIDLRGQVASFVADRRQELK
ncbi:unnamed protein product, partial [Prorocentrum cordatum]